MAGNSETQPIGFECRSTMTKMSRIKGPSVKDKVIQFFKINNFDREGRPARMGAVGWERRRKKCKQTTELRFQMLATDVSAQTILGSRLPAPPSHCPTF